MDSAQPWLIAAVSALRACPGLLQYLLHVPLLTLDTFRPLRLERLILSSNQLSHISPPPIPIADSSTYTTHFSSINAPRHFASLIHVALADNPLKEWSDLEALDAWVRLGRRQVDAAGGASGASDESGPSMDDALQGLQSLVVGGECCELTKGKPNSSISDVIQTQRWN